VRMRVFRGPRSTEALATRRMFKRRAPQHTPHWMMIREPAGRPLSNLRYETVLLPELVSELQPSYPSTITAYLLLLLSESGLTTSIVGATNNQSLQTLQSADSVEFSLLSISSCPKSCHCQDWLLRDLPSSLDRDRNHSPCT